MIKILVVDDSALMRRVLSGIFTAAGDFEVGVARDGCEALVRLHDFCPDVVTLDVNMPRMDGLHCLDQIMMRRPCPVVMLSSLTNEGAEATVQALSLGAVDFMAKPAGTVSLSVDEFAPLLVEKMRAAAQARVRQSRRLAERVRLRAHVSLAPGGRVAPAVTARQGRLASIGLPADTVVLIGTSTGGPPALDILLRDLPADFPWPIVIAQHMPASFTGPMARRLDQACQISVTEVASPVLLAPGRAYIGKGDLDIILVSRSGGLAAIPAPASPEYRWHPSVDRLVSSAMELLDPERLVGVLMTGMGKDGAAAMGRLHAIGGRTIAEAQETAVVWGMPGELVRIGGADIVAPLDRIAAQLLEWAQ